MIGEHIFTWQVGIYCSSAKYAFRPQIIGKDKANDMEVYLYTTKKDPP